MAHFARIRARGLISDNTDYSSPRSDTRVLTSSYTPTEWYWRGKDASTSQRTLVVSAFATINGIMVHNTSSTAGEDVNIEFDSIVGTTTSVDTDYANANPDTITEGGTQSLDFVTDGAEVGGYVDVDGSNQNDGTYLIQAASTESVTLGTGESLSAETGDTDSTTFTWLRRTKMRVVPGGFLVFSASVFPDTGIRYQAEAGSPRIDVFVAGA